MSLKKDEVIYLDEYNIHIDELSSIKVSATVLATAGYLTLIGYISVCLDIEFLMKECGKEIAIEQKKEFSTHIKEFLVSACKRNNIWYIKND